MSRQVARFRARWGLAAVLTLSITSLIVVLMSLVTFMDIRRERSISRGSLEERGSQLADTLNDGLADPLYYTDVDRLRDMAEAVRNQHDISYVRIFDPEGRLLVSDSGERGTPSYEDDSPKYVTGYIDDEFGLSVFEDVQTRLKFSGNSLEVATPIQAGPQVLGAVQFAFADKAVGAKIDSIIQQHVWQGLILVAIGLVIAYAIARIATKPLQSLTAAARAIGGGNLDTPVVGSGARETRELGTALEGMRAELQELYSGLERQVALRTEDLLKTNEELADEIMQREHAEVEIQRLALAVTTVNDAVIIVGTEGEILFVNASSEKMLGYGHGEMLGMPVFSLHLDSPADTTAREILEATMKQGSWTGEIYFQKKTREVIPVRLSTALMNDDGGRPVGVVGIAQDITERKLIEERLRETSRLISVGELAAGVAHEINNPLTVVMGYAEILMERDVSEAVRTRLERIHAEAGRAVKIVENLLFFARSHAPRREYQSIADILGRAVEFKARDLSVNNIALTTEWPDDLPGTVVDEQQLIQVLLNVVTNAEQAIIEAQPRAKILIRAGMAGNRIRISVTDDGPGIPPGYLHKVFDPFVTTKAVGKGTGLGLSICYGIVRQHGGDMWAESVYGSGASFHIELPLVGPERWVDEPSEELQQMPLSRKRILVVDDEPNIRSLVMEALSVEGLTTVDQAEDGQEAWHKLQEAPYDCILLDLKMPGMGGRQFYHLIERSDREQAERVIFLTGDTVSLDTRAFLEATGNPVLSKPIRLEELQRQVLRERT